MPDGSIRRWEEELQNLEMCKSPIWERKRPYCVLTVLTRG